MLACPGSRVLFPWPGRSGTNTEKESARARASGSMYAPDTPNPWTSTTGAPSPTKTACMRDPTTSLQTLCTTNASRLQDNSPTSAISGDHRDLMPDAHRPIGAMPDSTRFAFVLAWT
jgi:hypothetical protein